jgi:hypothetical protein
MLRALLLLLSCLTNYETVLGLARGAFTSGVANMSALCCIGIGLAFRRKRFVRG